MNIGALLNQIDAETARAFVSSARHVIDAMLIEAERVEAAQSPEPRDYKAAGLDRGTPAGGWITAAELRSTVRQLNEAIAAERFVDGALFAIRLFSKVGG